MPSSAPVIVEIFGAVENTGITSTVRAIQLSSKSCCPRLRPSGSLQDRSSISTSQSLSFDSRIGRRFQHHSHYHSTRAVTLLTHRCIQQRRSKWTGYKSVLGTASSTWPSLDGGGGPTLDGGGGPTLDGGGAGSTLENGVERCITSLLETHNLKHSKGNLPFGTRQCATLLGPRQPEK